MNNALTGILPVLPTPFTDDGAVDPDAMLRVVGFARQAGVAGVVFPGFASEVEHLSADERATLLEKVVLGVGGAVPIVAGASAPTVDAVVANGQVALSLGIKWLMVQPPLAVGAGVEEVTAFFSGVAAGLPGARLILQNAPAPRGSDLSPETILQVARAVPEIAYVKEESLPAGPAISAILGGKPAHLLGVIGGGGARYILDEYQRGACAAMPALEIAGEHVEMDKAWRSGNRQRARDLYMRTLPLLVLQAVYRMRLTKHVMMRRGILHNTIVRAPTPQLDAPATEDIDQNLVELGILEPQPV